MRFANAEDGRSPRNPILAGFGPFCPQAMPRHDATAPPRSLRTSLRLMEPPRVLRSTEATCGLLGDQGIHYGLSARIQQPRARTVPLEARVTATWDACFLGVVGSANVSGRANRVRRRCSRIALCSGSLRCSQSALRRPPSTASLTSLDGTVCSAIVHARSRYRAFWSRVRQLMPAGRRFSRAGAAKARNKLSYTATAFVPLGAVPGNM
jgi:hypothetical protein